VTECTWVNYPDAPMPMVGANAYEPDDGDTVTRYHADSMGSTPANTDMVMQVRVGFDGPVPVCDWTQFHCDAAGRAPARIRRRLAPRGRHEPRQPHHLARCADDPQGCGRSDNAMINVR